MKEGNYLIVIMLILSIPLTIQKTSTVSSAKKKDPVKDCTNSKTEGCSVNATLTQVPIGGNQTISPTPKPKLAEFQIDARKTISISKDDLNDLLDVYMTKLAENAVAISDKEHEIIELQSKDKSIDDELKKFQELTESCKAQNISFGVTLGEKDKQIKNLMVKISTYEVRLKRKQTLLGQYRRLNISNTVIINALKSKATMLAAKLRERKDDLLADWEVATTSCIPHGKTSSIHLIQLPDFRPFLVSCDGITEAGSGWTVIQRRLNGSVDFYRNWDQYRKGFGKLNGDFFIGLEKLHRLTTYEPHELYISLQLFNGTTRFALYDNFVIGNEEEGYPMKLLGHYHGNASDAMRTHDKMKFSTYDKDNDEFTHINCAEYHHGAWWYDFCSRSNLNGKYFNQQTDNEQGIFWDRWYSFKSLKFVQMMIRPKNV